MSEPPPSATKTEDSTDFSANLNGDGDATEPTADILSALNQLNSDTIPTAPNSQEEIIKVEEQQPKQEEVPQQPQLSEWQLLRNRLRDGPHDPEGWIKFVELAENSGEIEEIKETYESLLETYPNTSSAQIAYLNHFMIPGSFGIAETIFKRILRSSPSVDLWKFYLTYVRRVNTKPGARDTVQKSYEFALNHVGQDKDSGDIWMDYIQFLKSGETTSTWEEQQKMDALRKVYHRAVQIPIENIERLWSELEAFESNLNKITAKKFMADLSPSYMQARTVLRQLQRHIGPLFPPAPASSTSRPPLYLPALPTFNAAERALVGAWKNYLKWEEGNPLELEEKDRGTLVQRVQAVYRKAVIRMRFYGEIWYMSYVWNSSVGKHEDALNILKEGIRANPSSFLLNFAYAEALEAKKDKDGVFAVFDNFTDVLRADLETLEARINSANSSFESNGSTKTLPAETSAVLASVAATGLTEAGMQSNNSSFNTQSSDERPPKSKELADKRTEYGLVWIMYMRAARRVESQQIARNVFGRCRKDRWIPWQVYEASALMEYHVCKAVLVATRIFEKGMEIFGNEEIEFVLRYLAFLIALNDDANARALFERAIVSFPPERARPLWERWARYEYQYGDLESAQKLEKRIAEVYPTDPPIKRFAQRHIYLGTDAIAARDLGFAMARQAGATGSSSSLARTDTQLSLLSTPNNNHQTGGGAPSHKRPASPDYRKRDERPAADYGPAHKRPRPMSPIRDRDRDRWEGPPRRRTGSPGWDRDRDRDGPPPRRMEREREEEKGVALPPVISWFVGQLPAPSVFDGPVFRTDDLMMVFRNAVIPSSTRVRSPPPPPPGPPRGGGRPPPDYGPYQGPTGGRGGRRY